MNKLRTFAVIAALAATLSSPALRAGGDMLEERQTIDGYTVTFHVMEAQPGKEMGGSHDFMLKIEKDGKVVSGVMANSKVIHPNNQEQTKMMMVMGEWLMAGYDLGHEGKHQLMVLFKTPDGAKHKGGVFYGGQ